MDVLTIAIDQLHPDPANARRHPQRNLDALMGSLLRFGQQKPLVIDANNIVRAGNGTLAAAKGARLDGARLRSLRIAQRRAVGVRHRR